MIRWIVKERNTVVIARHTTFQIFLIEMDAHPSAKVLPTKLVVETQIII
jgi:hypothetical protein